MQKHYIIPTWNAPKNISAVFTTRQDGNSPPPCDSFNFGSKNIDDPKNVEANREQLIRELNLPSSPCWLTQVHGNNVICVESCNKKYPQADASYSLQPKYVCAVITSDCLPILICNKSGTKVAAIHAGWRGLHSGVIENTLTKLQMKSEETLVALGPAIGPDFFEVGDEVREKFMQKNPASNVAFISNGKEGKWLANLYSLATQIFQAHGITEILGGKFCTFKQKDLFFSHRRDHGKTGRMAAVIWIK